MNTKFQLAFALLVGVAIGAVAVQNLYAQAKPPAFNIAEITVTNNDGYTKEYLPPVLEPFCNDPFQNLRGR
jgi:cell division septal protein FtsQ